MDTRGSPRPFGRRSSFRRRSSRRFTLSDFIGAAVYEAGCRRISDGTFERLDYRSPVGVPWKVNEIGDRQGLHRRSQQEYSTVNNKRYVDNPARGSERSEHLHAECTEVKGSSNFRYRSILRPHSSAR